MDVVYRGSGLRCIGAAAPKIGGLAIRLGLTTKTVWAIVSATRAEILTAWLEIAQQHSRRGDLRALGCTAQLAQLAGHLGAVALLLSCRQHTTPQLQQQLLLLTCTAAVVGGAAAAAVVDVARQRGLQPGDVSSLGQGPWELFLLCMAGCFAEVLQQPRLGGTVSTLAAAAHGLPLFAAALASILRPDRAPLSLPTALLWALPAACTIAAVALTAARLLPHFSPPRSSPSSYTPAAPSSAQEADQHRLSCSSDQGDAPSTGTWDTCLSSASAVQDELESGLVGSLTADVQVAHGENVPQGRPPSYEHVPGPCSWAATCLAVPDGDSASDVGPADAAAPHVEVSRSGSGAQELLPVKELTGDAAAGRAAGGGGDWSGGDAAGAGGEAAAVPDTQHRGTRNTGGAGGDCLTVRQQPWASSSGAADGACSAGVTTRRTQSLPRGEAATAGAFDRGTNSISQGSNVQRSSATSLTDDAAAIAARFGARLQLQPLWPQAPLSPVALSTQPAKSSTAAAAAAAAAGQGCGGSAGNGPGQIAQRGGPAAVPKARAEDGTGNSPDGLVLPLPPAPQLPALGSTMACSTAAAANSAHAAASRPTAARGPESTAAAAVGDAANAIANATVATDTACVPPPLPPPPRGYTAGASATAIGATNAACAPPPPAPPPSPPAPPRGYIHTGIGMLSLRRAAADMYGLPCMPIWETQESGEGGRDLGTTDDDTQGGGGDVGGGSAEDEDEDALFAGGVTRFASNSLSSTAPAAFLNTGLGEPTRSGGSSGGGGGGSVTVGGSVRRTAVTAPQPSALPQPQQHRRRAVRMAVASHWRAALQDAQRRQTSVPPSPSAGTPAIGSPSAGTPLVGSPRAADAEVVGFVSPFDPREGTPLSPGALTRRPASSAVLGGSMLLSPMPMAGQLGVASPMVGMAMQLGTPQLRLQRIAAALEGTGSGGGAGAGASVRKESGLIERPLLRVASGRRLGAGLSSLVPPAAASPNLGQQQQQQPAPPPTWLLCRSQSVRGLAVSPAAAPSPGASATQPGSASPLPPPPQLPPLLASSCTSAPHDPSSAALPYLASTSCSSSLPGSHPSPAPTLRAQSTNVLPLPPAPHLLHTLRTARTAACHFVPLATAGSHAGDATPTASDGPLDSVGPGDGAPSASASPVANLRLSLGGERRALVRSTTLDKPSRLGNLRSGVRQLRRLDSSMSTGSCPDTPLSVVSLPLAPSVVPSPSMITATGEDAALAAALGFNLGSACPSVAEHVATARASGACGGVPGGASSSFATGAAVEGVDLRAASLGASGGSGGSAGVPQVLVCSAEQVPCGAVESVQQQTQQELSHEVGLGRQWPLLLLEAVALSATGLPAAALAAACPGLLLHSAALAAAPEWSWRHRAAAWASRGVVVVVAATAHALAPDGDLTMQSPGVLRSSSGGAPLAPRVVLCLVTVYTAVGGALSYGSAERALAAAALACGAAGAVLTAWWPQLLAAPETVAAATLLAEGLLLPLVSAACVGLVAAACLAHVLATRAMSAAAAWVDVQLLVRRRRLAAALAVVPAAQVVGALLRSLPGPTAAPGGTLASTQKQLLLLDTSVLATSRLPTVPDDSAPAPAAAAPGPYGFLLGIGLYDKLYSSRVILAAGLAGQAAVMGAWVLGRRYLPRRFAAAAAAPAGAGNTWPAAGSTPQVPSLAPGAQQQDQAQAQAHESQLLQQQQIWDAASRAAMLGLSQQHLQLSELKMAMLAAPDVAGVVRLLSYYMEHLYDGLGVYLLMTLPEDEGYDNEDLPAGVGAGDEGHGTAAPAPLAVVVPLVKSAALRQWPSLLFRRTWSGMSASSVVEAAEGQEGEADDGAGGEGGEAERGKASPCAALAGLPTLMACLNEGVALCWNRGDGVEAGVAAAIPEQGPDEGGHTAGQGTGAGAMEAAEQGMGAGWEKYLAPQQEPEPQPKPATAANVPPADMDLAGQVDEEERWSRRGGLEVGGEAGGGEENGGDGEEQEAAGEPSYADLHRLAGSLGASGLIAAPLHCMEHGFGLLVVASPACTAGGGPMGQPGAAERQLDEQLFTFSCCLANEVAAALCMKHMQAELAVGDALMQDIMPADAVQVLKRSFLRNMGGTPAGTPTAAVTQSPPPPPPPATAACTPFTSAAAHAVVAAAAAAAEPSSSYGEKELNDPNDLNGSNDVTEEAPSASGPDDGPAITIVRNSFPGGAVPDTPPLSAPPHHTTTGNPSTSRGLSIAPPASPGNPPDAGLSPVLPSVPFSPTNPDDGPLRTSSVATTMGHLSSFTSTITTFGRGSSFAYSLPSTASLGTIPSFSRNAAKASAASGRSFFLQRPPLGSTLQRSPSYGGPARPLVGADLNPHLEYGSGSTRERSSWPAMSIAHHSTTSSSAYGSHQHGSSFSQLPSTVLMSPPPGPLPPIGQEADGEVEGEAGEEWLEAKNVDVAMEAAGAQGAGRKQGGSRLDTEGCTVAGSSPPKGVFKSADAELGEFGDGVDGDGDGNDADVSGEWASGVAAAAGGAAAAGQLDSRVILSSILETEALELDRTDPGADGGSRGSSGRYAEVYSPASERDGQRPRAGMPPSPDGCSGGSGGRQPMLHRSSTTPAESLTGASSLPLPSQLAMVRSSVSARTPGALGLGSGGVAAAASGRTLTAVSAAGSRASGSRASGSGAPSRRSCELIGAAITAARAVEATTARSAGGGMDITGSAVHSSSGPGGPVLALRPLPLVLMANQRSSSSGAAAVAAATAFSSGIVGAGPSLSSGSHFLRRSVTDHLTVDDPDLGTPTLRRLMGFRGGSAAGTPAGGGGGGGSSMYGSPLAHVRSLHLASAAPDSPMSYGTGLTPTSGLPGAAGGGGGGGVIGGGGTNSPLQQSGGGTRILAGTQEVPYKQWHRNVSVLFADIVGYTTLARSLEPEAVMAMLHSLFSRYDDMLGPLNVYKVETIGDAYMAATGLLQESPSHAVDMVRFGVGMIRSAAQVSDPVTGAPLRVRVGINSGSVMSGIVGSCRARYCLFGDTVNTASRMESTGVPGAIQITEDTYMALPEEERGQWSCRGHVEVKGKGLLKTYLLQIN